MERLQYYLLFSLRAGRVLRWPLLVKILFLLATSNYSFGSEKSSRFGFCENLIVRRQLLEVGRQFRDHVAAHGSRITRVDIGSAPTAQSVDRLLNDALTPILKAAHQLVFHEYSEQELLAIAREAEKNYRHDGPFPYGFDDYTTKRLIQLGEILTELSSFANIGARIKFKLRNPGVNPFGAQSLVWDTSFTRSKVFNNLSQIAAGRISDFLEIPIEVEEQLTPRHFTQLVALRDSLRPRADQILAELWGLTDLLRQYYAYQRSFEQDDKVLEAVRQLIETNRRQELMGGLLRLDTFDYEYIADENYLISSHLRAPILGIGEYGVDFNRRLRRTARVLFEIVRRDLSPLAQDLDALTNGLIRATTARGRPSLSENDSRSPLYDRLPVPVRQFQEGVTSLIQLISITMAERQPEVGERDQILHDLLTPLVGKQNSLAVYITRMSRALMVGPASVGGYYFDRPYRRGDNGELKVSEAFKARLIEHMRRRIEKADLARANAAAHSIQVTERTAVGLPCPVASPCEGDEKTGIQYLADMFLRVYDLMGEISN